MAPLTEAQEKVLVLLPIVPAIMSMIGSSTIIHIVYKHYRTKKSTTVYHRLLVGMSLCDLFSSFWVPWFSVLVPADTSTRAWAIGSKGTCAFTGFVYTFSLVSGMLYNVSLSFYFLLTARFGWRDKDIAKRCELWWHLLVIFYPFVCGTTFLIMGVYAEQVIGGGCWISEFGYSQLIHLDNDITMP